MTLTIARTVDEALTMIAQGARPIAGGTDLVVAARSGKAPLPPELVAIDRLTELAGVTGHDPTGPAGGRGDSAAGGGDGVAVVRIGAITTHRMLLASPVINQRYTALADAAAMIGSPATRHLGTIGGNIMNASPAMDTGAPLVALGADVELRSAQAVRTVPVASLWRSPGVTVADHNELCTAVVVPDPLARFDGDHRHGSAYFRLEYRRAMEIAVVGAAVSVVLGPDGTVAHATVALSAVAPTIIGVQGLNLEAMTVDAAASEAAAAAQAQAQPISDLRASDRYRRHGIGVMTRRAFAAAAHRATTTEDEHNEHQ